MTRSLFALALFASSFLAGCGESPVVYKDPNDLPPIDAEAGLTAQREMDAVTEAERAEGAKIPSNPTRGAKNR